MNFVTPPSISYIFSFLKILVNMSMNNHSVDPDSYVATEKVTNNMCLTKLINKLLTCCVIHPCQQHDMFWSKLNN